jgi:hypothetical protein
MSCWELRLIMEYCDKGTLRDGLDKGLLGEPSASEGVGVAHHDSTSGTGGSEPCSGREVFWQSAVES